MHNVMNSTICQTCGKLVPLNTGACLICGQELGVRVYVIAPKPIHTEDYEQELVAA